MDHPYVILSDVSADIPPAMAKRYDIRFIPMHYTLGEEDRLCSCMEPDEVLHRFYEGQRNGDLTHTTQISPQTYIDVFRPYAEQGMPILYLSLSSGLSNTYQSARMAANELMEQYPSASITCVDTLSATGGMGILLEAAARNRTDGMSLAENAAWLEQNRLRVCHWFMVEDLMYLKRGGRVSAASAVVGTALNIKPILRIKTDGSLENFQKKRGVRAAMKQLVELYASASTKQPGERVYIIHADCAEKADFLEQNVRELNPDSDIVRVMLSPIIGAHTGPGMCAIAHLGKPGCESTRG